MPTAISCFSVVLGDERQSKWDISPIYEGSGLAVDRPVSLRMAGFEGGYAEGSFLWIVNNIYFQYYSLLIFLVSVAVMIGASYLGEATPASRSRG